jgi:hypothetical protein
MFYYYLITTSSSFWAFVYDSAEKQMLNVISLIIEQQKNKFERIAKVRFFPIYFYALRGWYHFPETCQDLFLAKGWYHKYSKPLNKFWANYYTALLISYPLPALVHDISPRADRLKQWYMNEGWQRVWYEKWHVMICLSEEITNLYQNVIFG